MVQAAGKAESTAAVRKAEEDSLRGEQQLTAAREALKPGDAKLKQAVAAAEQQVAAFRATLLTAQKAAAKPSPRYKPLGPVYPSMSSGRRLALARWIASKENPLTARVAVNHIWLRHMGAPFVGTVYNFGPNGKRPTHPALLDWLAMELTDSGWSMKHLHRLIVTSNTYRMQSASAGPSDPNLARDPENQYLWRMNYRRMEAEVVRDSMLYLAGQLDTASGGPDLDPASAETTRRRSVYYRHTPDDSALFLQMFDAANPAECYRRTESVMPQQALALANSGLSLTESKLLAQRLAQQCAPATVGNDVAFVGAAFEEVLGRAPTAAVCAKCETFLRAHGSGPPSPAVDPRSRARESLVHVLFNHNDFVTIR